MAGMWFYLGLSIGVAVGFATCAVLTMSKRADGEP